jgi:serine phosphatase RsbU (regulator of sigma subunit)
MLLAIGIWFRIAKPRLVRSWRGVALTIALLIVILLPDVPVIGTLLMIIVLLRLKWTAHIHGWRRTAALFSCFILLVLLSADLKDTHTGEGTMNISRGLADNPSIQIVGEDLPESTASVIALTAPWDNLIRVVGHLLRLQLLIACFQLLVFPIRLRGLSLKRRFTVTMILYRVIPGFLGFVVLVLGVYFGIGLHKTRLAQEALNETLNRNLQAAEIILDASSGWSGIVPGKNVLDAFDDARRWNTPEMTPAHYVLKWVGLRFPPPDSGSSATAEVDSILGTVSTPGTPEKLLRTDFFGAGVVETVAGMTVADTVLYLGGARALRQGDTAVVAEVYVPVDSLYLSRIADLVTADVRLRAIPNVFIGRGLVTEGDRDSTWADSAFTVAAVMTGDSEQEGLWYTRLFLAKSFIPLSNWREDLAGGVTGAAELTLSVAPARFLRGIVSNTIVFSSNVVAILIFFSILALFLIAEYSAARTGRSIIRGILDDVKGLAEAARRFGDGDLGHRVEVRGKDELGSLSSSFNTMAENIEENQELLLEKERLEADLALARDIQQRLLPQSPPVLPGLDVAGISIPSREVGGDLFYFLPVPDGRLGLTIGDVSGKSVPAALLMSNVLAALKTEARLVEDESEILTHLNRLIVEQVEPGRFVTFFYGVIDRKKGLLNYACAGHNPPLKIGADGSAEWLTEAGVPLGVLPENTYAPAESPLETGDVLVLYSDGVTEAEKPRERAIPSEDGEEVLGETPEYEEPDFFDEHRLEEVVRGARGHSASEIVEAVVDAVQAYTGGADLSDDLTLVVVRITEADRT